MTIGKTMRIATGVMFAWMVTVTLINSGAPSTTAAATPTMHHKAVAEGFIERIATAFRNGFDYIQDQVFYYAGQAGNYIYDHTNPCTTQECNK